MKLYYFPGACSMASHIVTRELNLPVELVRADFATRTTENGDDYLKVNPEGYVPALQLEDGAVITESAAILQYLADTVAPSPLLPPPGDLERYRVVEFLSFISTEIHQSLGPLLSRTSDDQAKAAVVAKVHGRLRRLERALSQSAYLTGPDFTIADAYAFAILAGLQHFKIPLDGFPQVGAFFGRVAARPAVVATLRAEGLTP